MKKTGDSEAIDTAVSLIERIVKKFANRQNVHFVQWNGQNKINVK